MPFRTISPVLCRCVCAAALLVVATANASADPPADKAAKAGDAELIGKRIDKPDGSAAITLGRRLPSDWETKVGVDLGLAAPLTTTPPPQAHLDGWSRQDRSSAAGWASIAVPAASLGLDKAAVEARIDPAKDQGRLATSLARSLPLGDAARLTVQHGYALTETLAGAWTPALPAPGQTPTSVVPSAPATQTLTTEGKVSLDLLSSSTTFAAGTRMSSTDDRWLGTLSAEQKLFGGPFSLTGSISERATGETDKSVKAGFKHAW